LLGALLAKLFWEEIEGGDRLDRPQNEESPAECGAFSEAAEGTRTLDLLHGKQTL
jgi:hypothetical protein